MNSPGSVLIVEDNPDDRVLLARAFKKAQISSQLQFAEDGEQALSMLEAFVREKAPETWPSFILLDLKLPRVSGLEVLEWLKRTPGLRRIPVVILTSSAQNADIADAYDLGANSYLVKPVRSDDLQVLVAAMSSYWMRFNQLTT